TMKVASTRASTRMGGAQDSRGSSCPGITAAAVGYVGRRAGHAATAPPRGPIPPRRAAGAGGYGRRVRRLRRAPPPASGREAAAADDGGAPGRQGTVRGGSQGGGPVESSKRRWRPRHW